MVDNIIENPVDDETKDDTKSSKPIMCKEAHKVIN